MAPITFKQFIFVVVGLSIGLALLGQVFPTVGGLTFNQFVIVLLALALGLWLLVRGVFDALIGVNARKWPTARGTVTSSEVVQTGRGRCCVSIAYTYRAGGHELVGKRVFVGDWLYTSLVKAQARAAKYPPSTPVDVHYDPANPSRAVLEPGLRIVAFFPIAVGVLFCLLGTLPLLL